MSNVGTAAAAVRRASMGEGDCAASCEVPAVVSSAMMKQVFVILTQHIQEPRTSAIIVPSAQGQMSFFI
jgi:hypothetical protein